MEQEAVIQIDSFDHNQVDLEKPASTVEEYIKQVIVSRERCADVAVADNIDRTNFKKPRCIVPADVAATVGCSYTPSKEWRQAKIDNFEVMRKTFERRRARHPPIERYTPNSSYETAFEDAPRLPAPRDYQAWIQTCLQSRSSIVRIDNVDESKFAHHKGTPPATEFILMFDDNTINCLIIHLTNYFTQHGYSRALAEWLFSLAIAVKTPLIHDVCSALREFTRICRLKRAELDESKASLIREYTLFIAIVGIFFNQKDLADK